MPKRKQTPPRPRDMNELAIHIGKIATHEIEDVTPAENPASKRGEAKAAKAVAETPKGDSTEGGTNTLEQEGVIHEGRSAG